MLPAVNQSNDGSAIFACGVRVSYVIVPFRDGRGAMRGMEEGSEQINESCGYIVWLVFTGHRRRCRQYPAIDKESFGFDGQGGWLRPDKGEEGFLRKILNYRTLRVGRNMLQCCPKKNLTYNSLDFNSIYNQIHLIMKGFH